MPGQQIPAYFYMNKKPTLLSNQRQVSISERILKWILILPPYVFLLAFLVCPAFIMVLVSLSHPGEFGGVAPFHELLYDQKGTVKSGFTTETFHFVFSDFIFLEILLKSFFVALITTVTCLAVAYPLALAIARSDQKLRGKLVLMVILPFASNFLIRVYAWIIILGPLNLLYTSYAVFIGMVYVHLPFMILPLYANLEQHDSMLVDAAHDLGATPWQSFWHITLPLSIPGIFSGSILVFIPVLGSFAISELLGGTKDILIGNLIKEQFLESRDWPFGATLSLILSLIVLIVVKVATAFSKPRGVP